jgi:uncharacterized protein
MDSIKDQTKANDLIMSESILERFIKQKIEASSEQVINFTWQGGEPTLAGIEFYQKVLKFQKKYNDGKKLENSIQTNGVLLNDDWCIFFKENSFLVGISIDGPEELHDKFRKYRDSKGSFKQVMEGVNLLRKHNVDFNILTCVHIANEDHPIEVYRFLKELGGQFIQFIPVVERELNHENSPTVTDWSVGSKQYGDFLITIFNDWIRKDVGKYFIQIFDVALEVWYGLKPGLCLYTETCGRAVVIETDGNIYSCDHFVQDKNLIGNIKDDHMGSIISNKKQKLFGNNKSDSLPKYCSTCEYLFICNGECPKNRFIKSPTGENNLNYLCKGLKKFFSHIDHYMVFMANEVKNNRSPAIVMNWHKNTFNN